ncbi:MAG: tRNA preQ1(34) S-adenosylmethionine ribosyltransferase-isomerase QueA [Magnetococcales bacterium]|nr:tRNA preQ1(34) S-adenosylmethionine ribosyltransferase-isomerase QueA [Magnetococcales bacterium]
MSESTRWQLSDFDYHLPPECIAQEPVEPRDVSRLLVSRSEGIEESRFREVGAYLKPGDLVVINDTRVLPARLLGKKPTGGRVEVFLLKPLAHSGEWEALIGSNKPVKLGQEIIIADGFRVRVLERLDGRFRVGLDVVGDPFDAIHQYGRMPLPPYIQQQNAQRDQERYQTVFAKETGAVAAPTAGLHFTPQLMAKLQAQGVRFAHITLHVGLGTFQPVRVDDLSQHVMHREWCRVSEETARQINSTREQGGKIVAVGTTVARTLESAVADDHTLQAWEGETDLFILPGYRFRLVDALITNFHLPGSTLLMLVAAFIGKPRLDRDYAHAINQRYRFYSYGDASLLLP